MSKIKTSFYITPDLHQRLQDEAGRLSRPVNALVVEAVRRHLDRTAPIGAAMTLAHSLVDSVADYRTRDPNAALPPWYDDNVFGEGEE